MSAFVRRAMAALGVGAAVAGLVLGGAGIASAATTTSAGHGVAAVAASPNNTIVTINSDGVTAYQEPSTSSTVLQRFNNGDQVQLIQCLRNTPWCAIVAHIYRGDVTGYVQAQYLDRAFAGISAYAPAFYPITEPTPIYYSSQTLWTPIATAQPGDKVEVLSKESLYLWQIHDFNNNVTGWIRVGSPSTTR